MKRSARLVRALRAIVLLAVLVTVVGIGLPSAQASDGNNLHDDRARPVFVRGTQKILRAGSKRTRVSVPPSPDRPHGQRPALATFEISYEGFPAEARTAFQYAADIWARQLTTTVPIKIRASWMQLDRGALAGAQPHMYAANFANAPRRDTLYPIALANKLAGYDLIPSGVDDYDIDVVVNSGFDPNDLAEWSFRTDGDWEYRAFDLVTVALHEIAHGLGFSGSMTAEEYVARWGGTNGFPEIYDRFTVNGAGQSLIDTSLFPNPSNVLYEQLTEAVYWNGTNGVAATGGEQPELWAPSSWAPGSSYAHLSEYRTREGSHDYQFDRLMTPQLDLEEVIHDPGPIARGILRDLGWNVEAVPLPGRPSGRLEIFPDYTHRDSDADTEFINNDVEVKVTNYNGHATSLMLYANEAVIYDGPFTPDGRRTMRLKVFVPGAATCERTSISGRLRNADGESEPFSAAIIVDTSLQTSVRITKPPTRPSNSPSEGPLRAGAPGYIASDSVHVRVPNEGAGCSGLHSFTLVYEAVPQGTPPNEYGEVVDPWRKDVDKDIPIFGRAQQPIVSGVYDFHVDLSDKLGNRARFPSGNGVFRMTVDTRPPTAHLDPAPSPPSEAIGPGFVLADLTNLHVTDDLYPDQGQGQPYWGYWVIVKPATVLPPTLSEWQQSGVVMPGRAPKSFLWRIPQPSDGGPVPAVGYRMWVRVLDGAGNASAAVTPALTPVDPFYVHLPLIHR